MPAADTQSLYTPPHESVYWPHIPLQHCFAEAGSPPGLTQEQIPCVQRSVAHARSSMHAEPVGSGSWHVPASQNPAQAASSAQGVPAGCVAAHVPMSQKPDWQSPSPVQAPTSGCTHTNDCGSQRSDEQSMSRLHCAPAADGPQVS